MSNSKTLHSFCYLNSITWLQFQRRTSTNPPFCSTYHNCRCESVLGKLSGCSPTSPASVLRSVWHTAHSVGIWHSAHSVRVCCVPTTAATGSSCSGADKSEYRRVCIPTITTCCCSTTNTGMISNLYRNLFGSLHFNLT